MWVSIPLHTSVTTVTRRERRRKVPFYEGKTDQRVCDATHSSCANNKYLWIIPSLLPLLLLRLLLFLSLVSPLIESKGWVKLQQQLCVSLEIRVLLSWWWCSWRNLAAQTALLLLSNQWDKQESSRMDDNKVPLGPLLLRGFQATCLVFKLVYFSIYFILVILSLLSPAYDEDEDPYRKPNPNISVIGFISQCIFVLFTISIGLISSVTWNMTETAMYAAFSFILFGLNAVKYGLPFMDPVIFSLDSVLLLLAFWSLRLKVSSVPEKCAKIDNFWRWCREYLSGKWKTEGRQWHTFAHTVCCTRET